MTVTVNPKWKAFHQILPIVASFEGTGYDGVTGNFDGCGITFGVIGFNIKQGSGISLLENLFKKAPLDAYQLVGESGWHPNWTSKNWLNWANIVTVEGSSYVKPMVADKIRILIGSEQGRKTQDSQAWEVYGQRAWYFCEQFGFTTYRQLLFALDTTVQQGGFRRKALDVWQKTKSLKNVGQYMASLALPQWKSDVLQRRMLIATGAGIVHGRRRNFSYEYNLDLDQRLPVTMASTVKEPPSLESRVD